MNPLHMIRIAPNCFSFELPRKKTQSVARRCRNNLVEQALRLPVELAKLVQAGTVDLGFELADLIAGAGRQFEALVDQAPRVVQFVSLKSVARGGSQRVL